MKTKNRRRGNLMLRLAGLLLLLTVLSTYFAGSLLAKYISSDSAANQARVGAFVLRVNKDGTNSTALRLDGIEKPGDTATYAFTVQNFYSASQLAEVDESYTLSVHVNGDMPLSFTLRKPDSATETLTLDGVNAKNTPAGIGGSFKAAVSKTDRYLLTVTWPQTENSWLYASDSSVASCVLTVTGVQTD